MLLCKGHMGSEDVLKPGIVMADWDVFGDYVGRFSLAEAVERLAAYDYLPVEGKDFTVDVTRLQFGDWVLGWKQFHAPELPGRRPYPVGRGFPEGEDGRRPEGRREAAGVYALVAVKAGR